MIYETIKILSRKKGLSINQLEKTLGLSKGSLCRIDTNRPSVDRLQKIADFFEVSLDYLMTGKEQPEKRVPELTTRDKRDIAKDLDRIMEEIANDTDGPLFYNDRPIPKNKIDLLRNAIEVALEDAKAKNKETFRPYKHKPRPEKN